MTNFTSRAVRAGGFMVMTPRGFRHAEAVTILSGQSLKAGAVLGRQLVGGTAAAVADSGNTGNGAMGAVTAGNAAMQGAYRLVVEAAAANAGTFVLYNPSGIEVGRGQVASAFSGGGLSFTLADGSTDFAVGDAFTLTVSGGVGKYKEYNPGNTDGSQVVAGILWDDCDATAGDTKATAVVRDCEVNQGELTWFSGASGGQITAGIAGLTKLGIVARPSIPA